MFGEAGDSLGLLAGVCVWLSDRIVLLGKSDGVIVWMNFLGFVLRVESAALGCCGRIHSLMLNQSCKAVVEQLQVAGILSVPFAGACSFGVDAVIA